MVPLSFFVVWCGDRPLKEAFAELFCIACNKEALVMERLIFRNDTVHWAMNFTCTVQDWDLESITFFLYLLSTLVKGFDPDMLCWKGFN